MSSQNYEGLIFTNHALDQLARRGLKQDLAWQTWRSPEKSLPGKTLGTTEFQKNFGERKVTLIAKLNDQKEWVVISCWVNPPYPGSIDATNNNNYKKYQKSGFWRKFFLTFKKQLGF